MDNKLVAPITPIIPQTNDREGRVQYSNFTTLDSLSSIKKMKKYLGTSQIPYKYNQSKPADKEKNLKASQTTSKDNQSKLADKNAIIKKNLKAKVNQIKPADGDANINKNLKALAVKPKVNSRSIRPPSTRPPVKNITNTRTPVNIASITRPTPRPPATSVPTKRKNDDTLTGCNVRSRGSRVSLAVDNKNGTVNDRNRVNAHSKLDQIKRRNTNISSNKTVAVSANKFSMLRQPTVFKHATNVNTNGQAVPSKVETTSIPNRKRKNEEDTQTTRNVRSRVSDDHNSRSNQAEVLLSEAQTERALAIAERTSLEVEEERLKSEFSKTFSELCRLEHVLACEQFDATSLFDQLENKRSEYPLFLQEKAELVRSLDKFQELEKKADLELNEMAELLNTNKAQLADVTKLLDEKVHNNAVLKSSVNELKKKKRSSRRYKK
jgi:hypothetical protein